MLILTSTVVVQTIGGAFLVSAGQSAFEAKLTEYLLTSDAAISPIQVIGTGATDIRTVFTAEEVPIILRAYVHGIQTAFIVAIALAGACTIIAFGAKWQKMQAAPKDGQAPSPEISVEAKSEEV
jgi:MFS transporter, DHA2 family, glioxin efflux transporter